MDEQYAIDILSGRKRGIFPAALRAGCGIASWAYAAAVRLRNQAYDRGWKPIIPVDAPVISLGNLTAGGTGKTPVAAYLAERLQARGHRPAIVSRGYRSLASQINDERLVLEQLVPGVPQILNRDRVAGAQAAIRTHGCDVVLLDDGFQHRRLHRDLDLVLIDATQPWGFGRLLPRGLLREPMSNLRRADLFLLTRCDQVESSERAEIRREMSRWNSAAACVELRFAPRRLRNAAGEFQPLAALAERRCLPFCGIGNPEGFRRTLARLGVTESPVVFPDHHHYGPGDVAALARRADESQASAFVTTQKDLVKFADPALAGRPLWAIEIAAEIESGADLLDQALGSLPTARRFAA